MSGLEFAGVALGAVPILIVAAKAYQTLHDRLDTLRRRHKVAQRLWLKYRFIQTRLRTTFRRFLAHIVHEDDPWGYIQTTGLSIEQQEDVATYIDTMLGANSASMFAEAFNEISALLNQASESLIHVESLASASAMPMSAPSMLKGKSIKSAADLTIHESEYETQLEELRTWVGEISDLLSTGLAIPAKEQAKKGKDFLPLPSWVNSINMASKQLAAGLEQAWTCSNTSHGSHSAMMRFDAQMDMEDAVHMDIAIRCHASGSLVSPKSKYRDIRLHVKSVAPIMSEHKQNKRTRQSVAALNDSTNVVGLDSTTRQGCTAPILQPPIGEHDIEFHRKLEGLSSVCCHLCVANYSRPMQESRCCRSYMGTVRGYLGTSAAYEHAVYYSEPRSGLDQSLPSRTLSSRPVSECLEDMTWKQQLQTAYELTMSVLQYNRTSWLREEWSLSDVFHIGASSFENSTLHLTKGLPEKKIASRGQAESGPPATTPLDQELQMLLGIRNAPLASLGHALLELAHRKPLKDLRQSGDPCNAVAARRLLNGVYIPFGDRYRRVVRKCLEADFVVECTDLADGRLQTAVYNDVALELDSLAKEIESVLSHIPG